MPEMLILLKLAFAITSLILLIAFVIILVLVIRRERRDDKHPYEMGEIDLYRRSKRWPD
jgi:hypothetical protein